MQQLASMLILVLSIYSMAIIVRIILSWGGMGTSRFGGFYAFLVKITDPYLAFFRHIPGLQRGMFDFSPVFAMIVLGILQNMLSIFVRQGKITFASVLALIVQAAWSVLSFFLILFIILSIVRLVLEYRPSANSIHYISILDNLLKGVQEKVHRYVFGGREMAVRTLLIWSAVSLTAFYFLLRALSGLLIGYILQLPF